MLSVSQWLALPQRVTLGFSRATRTRTPENPYPCSRVRALPGTGTGFPKTSVQGVAGARGTTPDELLWLVWAWEVASARGTTPDELLWLRLGGGGGGRRGTTHNR